MSPIMPIQSTHSLSTFDITSLRGIQYIYGDGGISMLLKSSSL